MFFTNFDKVSAWSPAIPFDGGGGVGAEEGVGRIGERAEESSSQGLARSPAMSLDDGLFEEHDSDGGSMGLEAGGGAAPLVRWRWRRRRPSLGHDVTGEGREGGLWTAAGSMGFSGLSTCAV